MRRVPFHVWPLLGVGVVSLAALVAGSELFGIWGALFASPVAGVLQALLVAFWVQWRETHPDHFNNVIQE